MEDRHNSAALTWTVLLLGAVVMLFILQGLAPKPPLGGDAIWMQAAGVVSLLGLIQCWRIGGGLGDFIFASGFGFSAQDLKEHGFVLPVFIGIASNSFLLVVFVDLLMLVTGTQ
jgi:hypothetical protein